MDSFRQILRNTYLLAVLCVAVATAIFLPGRAAFAKGQWALLYILVIVLVARLWGARPAILAAAIAFFAWNYFFLPPFYSLSISDPRDLLSLGAFLIVGATVGYLTGRMKEREQIAIAREGDLALLNRFGSYLVSDMAMPEMSETLLKELTEFTQAEAAAIFLSDTRGGLELFKYAGRSEESSGLLKAPALWVFQNVKAIGLPENPGENIIGADVWPISVEHENTGIMVAGNGIFVPLQSASRVEGVIYVGEYGKRQNYDLHTAKVIVSLANQTAVFLERRRLAKEAVAGDVLREADKLKSTLLSSVSHELKTPLASAGATVTNLLEPDTCFDKESVKVEIESLKHDLDRLNSSISSLIDLSRLESADWKPIIDTYEVGEIIATVMSKIAPRQKTRISFSVPENLPAVRVDFNQLVQAVQNVLENALLYSPDNAPVEISAALTEAGLELSVSDEGGGVSADEKNRVFEKFFRGQAAAAVPTGTGLGLAVSREIVNHHGGTIRIDDNKPRGAQIIILLPKESLEETN